MGGVVDLSLEILDQPDQIVIFWNDQSQLLRVFERGVDMSCPAMETDERHQSIAIARMSGEILLEDCCCIFSLTGGMQCHRIDKWVSRAFRLDVGCPSQFRNGPIDALEARQRQSECMVQPGVLW